MQLDDVVSSTVTGPRVEEAMYRCVCWCMCARSCAWAAGLGIPILHPCFSTLHKTQTADWASCRSIRWLDRCIAAHQQPEKQNLFAIIQGGLDADLRATCLEGRAMFGRTRVCHVAESLPWVWHVMVLR